MAIDETSIKNGSVEFVAPDGSAYPAEIVSVAGSGNLFEVSYKFHHDFRHTDNGEWKVINSSANLVVDDAGNTVIPDKELGTFEVDVLPFGLILDNGVPLVDVGKYLIDGNVI